MDGGVFCVLVIPFHRERGVLRVIHRGIQKNRFEHFSSGAVQMQVMVLSRTHALGSGALINVAIRIDRKDPNQNQCFRSAKSYIADCRAKKFKEINSETTKVSLLLPPKKLF